MKRIVPANSVPAAAVIRGGQALFEMIGRKEHVDGFYSRHSGNIFVYLHTFDGVSYRESYTSIHL